MFLLFIVIVSNNNLIAQGEAALPFLNYPVSTMNAGMGSVGTSLPTDNVYGFLYNPAQLGYISQFSNFGFQFYLNKPEIKRDNFPYHPIGELNSFAFNLGYNFKKILPLPLSIGIAYSRSEILYQYYYFNNYINDRDEYKTYSVGIGTDYFVQYKILQY